MLFYFACEAAGASAPGIPHALPRAKTSCTTRAHSRRENADTRDPHSVIAREGVWSREIGERFERSDITEAFEAGPIVISHEAVEESITGGMARGGAAGGGPVWVFARKPAGGGGGEGSTPPRVWGGRGVPRGGGVRGGAG